MNRNNASQAAENYADEAMSPVWDAFPAYGIEWNDEVNDAISAAAWDAVAGAYQDGIKAARKAAVKAIRKLDD